MQINTFVIIFLNYFKLVFKGILLFTGLIGVVFAQTHHENNSSQLLKLRSHFTQIEPLEGTPRRFTLSTDTNVAMSEFFNRYSDLFGLGLHDLMIPIKSGTSVNKYRFTKFVQYHKNVPMIYNQFTLTEQNSRVVLGMGQTTANVDIGVIPKISKEDSIDIAKAELLRILELDLNDISFANNTKAHLVITKTRMEGIPIDLLAYRVFLRLTNPSTTFVADIDANSREILRFDEKMNYSFVPSTTTVLTIYEFDQSITLEQDTDTNFFHLQSDVLGLKAFDLNGAKNPDGGEEVISSSTFNDFPSRIGASAYWAGEQFLNFFANRYGRDGVDGAGGVYKLFIRWGEKDAEGFSDYALFGTTMNGGLIYNKVTLDTVVHEMAHGITFNSVGWFLASGLDYENESGALNESFSDVVAAVIEWYTVGPGTEWIVGEDYFPSMVGYRSLKDPKNVSYNDPDTYMKQNWHPFDNDPNEGNDYGGVHTNSGVPNYGFYLLSEGGQGTNDNNDIYDIVGVGRFAALDIAYLAFTEILDSDSDFADARDASIQAATILFGEFSWERISSENSWYAVGVGSEFSDTIHYSPSQNLSGVPLWPIELKWQIGIGEDTWDIEISTTADFSSNVIVKQTNQVGTDDPYPLTVGILDVLTLEPNTEYFWRVRMPNIDPDRGWRPTNRFLTSDQKAELVYPTLEHGPVHPWELKFDWKIVKGAVKYEVQVSLSDNFDDNLVIPSSFVWGENTTSAILDVPIGETLYWRVVALGPDDISNNVAASDSAQFLTKTPKVTIIKPVDGAEEYPWNLKFSWKPVTGAEKYIIEMSRDENITDANSLEQKLEFEGNKTEFTLNFRPAYLSENRENFWFVRVIGPKPLGEEGEPSEIESWVNNGNDTIPYILNSVPIIPFIDYQEETVELDWEHVNLAKKYVIQVFKHPYGTLDRGSVAMAAKELKRNDDPDHQTFNLSLASLPSLSSYGDNGYYWNVYSIGPDDINGLGMHLNTPIIITADRPEIVFPTSSSDKLPYENKQQFIYSSLFSPSKHYRIQLFRGSSCAPSRRIENDIFEGNPDDDSTILVDPLLHDRKYSWRVRAWSKHPALDAVYPWSYCERFKTIPKPIPCNTIIESGITSNTTEETFNVELGHTSGKFEFFSNAYPIPDKFIIYYDGSIIHDQACAGGEKTSMVEIPNTGNKSSIKVHVQPNCDPANQSEEDKWYFKVNCPN